MKIVLFGYGKMGKLIEQFALQRGHEIHLIVDENNRSNLTVSDLSGADMAVDFSIPEGAISNISLCFEAGLPIVVGTTGWYDHLDDIRQSCEYGNNSMLYGSNFSVGVNVLFHINKLLAKAMAPHGSYDAQVEEIHHIQKLDAPSGTAITLAQGILDNHSTKKTWINNVIGDGAEKIPAKDQLLIESHRLDDVPGTHTVVYSSDIDQIELKHVAHNRKGFAYGAVLAAEWLLGKTGFYEVGEMFDFS